MLFVHIRITKLSLCNRNLKNVVSIPAQFVNDSVDAEQERRNKEIRQGITKKGVGETNKQIKDEGNK
jgi:hypothetical protein